MNATFVEQLKAEHEEHQRVALEAEREKQLAAQRKMVAKNTTWWETTGEKAFARLGVEPHTVTPSAVDYAMHVDTRVGLSFQVKWAPTRHEVVIQAHVYASPHGDQKIWSLCSDREQLARLAYGGWIR